MNNKTEDKPLRPVVLVDKGCLGDRAIHDLRGAGYCVVQASDISQVKQFYPETFKKASDQAKILTFEYAIGAGPFNSTKHDLREIYINYLKQLKAF